MTRLASRRLLATLSSIPSTSSAPPLAPPYAHTTAPRSAPRSLQPPYTHSLSTPGKAGSSRINAPYRYSIAKSDSVLEAGQRKEVWKAWVEGILGDESARKEVVAVWEETLEGIHKAKIDGAQIPEIAYTSLSQHLSDSSTVDSIKSVGSVVIRDVVPDSTAMAWAKEIWEAIEHRQGDAVFWYPSILAARSNVCISNTTSFVLSAISDSNGEDAFILAEGVSEGLGSAGTNVKRTGNLRDIWATDKNRSPSTPLLAHLALTPPSPTSAQTLPPSIHSPTYALLRPLFQASRSRISFYSSEAYLSSSNWSLRSDLPISAAVDMPHLDDMATAHVKLNPGDIILRNSALQVEGAGEGGQAFLPVSPLPHTLLNLAYVKAQREAYEAGLPPPSAGVGAKDGWRVEETIGREGLEGWRGKKVMGY